MSLSDQALWDRITDFSIDEEGAKLPFLKRLARENKWSYVFALEAMDEYKKFIYLSCVSPTPLTPSEEVDEVWHLHLTYTKNYWDKFCKETLGRPFHHTPTNGDAAEREKFFALYEQTQLIYEKEFETPVPKRFWPTSKKRFGIGLTIFQYSEIPSKLKLLFSLLFGLVILAGCNAANLSMSGLFGDGEWEWWIFGGVVVLFLVLRKKGGGSNGGGCSGRGDSGCGGGD